MPHRIWNILEVVQLIANSSDSPRALYHLGLTSRMCFDAAIPLLWREMDEENLQNLFKILFPLWENGDHAIGVSNYERFKLYASFVRALDIQNDFAPVFDMDSDDGFIDDNNMHDLVQYVNVAAGLFSDNKAVWFPNLRRLAIREPTSLDVLFMGARFIVPSLNAITLHVSCPEHYQGSQTWSFAVTSLLRQVTRTAQRLDRTSLKGISCSDQRCESALADLLLKFSLTHLCCPPVLFSHNVATAASSQPALYSLILNETDEADNQPVGPLLTILQTFHSLRSLDVGGRPTVVLSLLRNMQADLIRLGLRLYSHHDYRPERLRKRHYRELSALIPQRYASVQHLILDVDELDGDDPFSLTSIQTLTNCHSILTFFVWHRAQSGSRDVTDSAMEDLVQGWPSLRSLWVYWPHKRTAHGKPQRPTMKTLIALRKHCPALQEAHFSTFSVGKTFPPLPLFQTTPQPFTFCVKVPARLVHIEGAAIFLALLWPQIRLHIEGESSSWKKLQSRVEILSRYNNAHSCITQAAKDGRDLSTSLGQVLIGSGVIPAHAVRN